MLDASSKPKLSVVIDYRKLNQKTVDDCFPLPNITEILDKLGRASYFKTLDLASGYHQIEVEPEYIPKPAFRTEDKMPFGLKNAPPHTKIIRILTTHLDGIKPNPVKINAMNIFLFHKLLKK